MRVFLGIELSDKIKSEILKWQKSRSNFSVRWIEKNNIHVTLVPPWWEKNPKKIIKTFENINLNTKPFSLKFKLIEFGPKNQPRLIWVQGEASSQIVSLQKELIKVFNQKQEDRPFKLHTTIARFRPEHFKSFEIKNIDEKIKWEMEVKNIVLFESQLSPKGANYKILARIKLD